jgi:probable F420-dependent oxidoreductase
VRVDLGRIGVWTTYRTIGEEHAGEAAALVERLGFGTFWLGGSPRLSTVRPLLEATEYLVVATGIVNVWAYDPTDLAAEYAELVNDFPDRLMVGIGIGHPEATSQYARPLDAMQSFLDGLDSSSAPLPRERRCLAALGPKMLDLSAERASGAHSYFVPAEHTRAARERIGPDALLAPELACVVDTEPGSARAKARQYAKLYLGLRNYTSNLLRFGFTEDDVGGGGSDALIDAVIPHGSAEAIATAVGAHLDAGANHVCLQPVGLNGLPRDEWTSLALALS